MSKINLGRVGFVMQGMYDAGKAYKRLDCVTADGVMYAARQDVPAGTPVSNTTYWQLVISGSDVTTPDWNQSDETASDYIKNRTHYEAEYHIDLAGAFDVEQDDWSWFYLENDAFKDINDGDTITLQVSGGENRLVLHAQNAIPAALNDQERLGGSNMYVYNDHLFDIMFITDYFDDKAIGRCRVGVHAPYRTIDSISISWSSVKKLDAKYLPDPILPTINIFEFMTEHTDADGDTYWDWDMSALREFGVTQYDEVPTAMSMYCATAPFSIQYNSIPDAEDRLIDLTVEAGEPFGLAIYSWQMSRNDKLRFKYGDKEFGIPSGFRAFDNTHSQHGEKSFIFIEGTDVYHSYYDTGTTSHLAIRTEYGEYHAPKIIHGYGEHHIRLNTFIDYQEHLFLLGDYINDPYGTYYAYDTHPDKYPVRIAIHNALGDDGWSVEPYDYGNGGSTSEPVLELIEEIHIDTDTNTLSRTKTPNGRDYAYSAIHIEVSSNGVASQNDMGWFNFNNYRYYLSCGNSGFNNANAYATIDICKVNGHYRAEFVGGSSSALSYTSSSRRSMDFEQSAGDDFVFTGFYWYNAGFKAGHIIRIYGVRADSFIDEDPIPE